MVTHYNARKAEFGFAETAACKHHLSVRIVRLKVTTDASKVTCSHCLRALAAKKGN